MTSDDIVHRLRHHPLDFQGYREEALHCLMEEAADEIERLHKEQTALFAETAALRTESAERARLLATATKGILTLRHHIAELEAAVIIAREDL